MPIINVSHASPLSDAVIEELMHGLTEVYTSVTGANAAAVHVLVQAVPAERWAVGGQSLAAKKAQAS